MGLIHYLLCASLVGHTLSTLEITAYEYNRKFLTSLDLGQCCEREEAVNMGNNSFYLDPQKCTLQQPGGVNYTPEEVNDVRNVVIPSPDLVVPLLGLCGGEAASFLGILNSGDCVAVEIASQLTFNDKTMVRAFIGNYQRSVDTLDEVRTDLDGMDNYLKDKLYLQRRTYGSLEAIIVQFRFDSVLTTQEAKKVRVQSLHMSSYMKYIESMVGLPKSVVVINLSTANHKRHKPHHFKKEDWDRAVRQVELLELEVQRTLSRINENPKNYHLIYRLHPFLENKDYRLSSPTHWEEISSVEVLIRQAMNLTRKTCHKCKGNKTKLCRRVRELRRKLVTAHAKVHSERASWNWMKLDQKSSLAALYTANVQSYNSVSRNLAKSVQEMKNKENNAKKIEKPPNSFNQIPRYSEESIHRRQRRMRMSAARNRLRSAPQTVLF